MSLRKKDYELIAGAVNQALNYHKTESYEDFGHEALRILVSILGYRFLLDNPKFDQSKFEKACGLNY